MAFQGNLLSKTLVIGIIFLLIGMSTIPSIAIDTDKKSSMLISEGNTLYVGGSGEGNYTSIQDAIDNASDGDNVFVYNGTYIENNVLSVSIELIGENRNSTIINGKRKDAVIKVLAEGVTISNFTIQKSSNDSYGIYILSDYNNIFSNYIEDGWGGILVRNGNYNKIFDNLVENIQCHGIKLHSYHGGICKYNNVFDNTIHFPGWAKDYSDGISVYDSDNIISGNTIIDCREAGIYINDECYDNLILNNNIMGVKRQIYSGILFRTGNYGIEASGNYISGCVHGILVNGEGFNISDNIIFDNKYGIYVAAVHDYPKSISNNNITNSRIIGISLVSYTSSCIVSNNIIDGGYYGIELEGSSNKIIRNTIKNTHVGVDVYGAFNRIISNNFIDNIKHTRFFNYGNRWDRNYWGEPLSHPKIIFGGLSALGFFYLIPWFNIDLRPAKEPYNIEVVI